MPIQKERFEPNHGLMASKCCEAVNKIINDYLPDMTNKERAEVLLIGNFPDPKVRSREIKNLSEKLRSCLSFSQIPSKDMIHNLGARLDLPEGTVDNLLNLRAQDRSTPPALLRITKPKNKYVEGMIYGMLFGLTEAQKAYVMDVVEGLLKENSSGKSGTIKLVKRTLSDEPKS